MNAKTYVGLDEDLQQGLGPTAKIFLDARVFGLIADSETGLGWNAAALQTLYDRVNAAWQPYGCLPSRLPDELRRRHAELYDAAIRTARAHGWDPDGELDD